MGTPFETGTEVIESHGCHIEQSEERMFDFFEIIGGNVPPEKIKGTKARTKIEEFLQSNRSHFQVYLPKSTSWTVKATDDLQKDLKKCKSLPPSPREVFAATEILQREIHIIELNKERNIHSPSSSFSHAVFAPSILTKITAAKDSDDKTPLIVFRFEDENGIVKFAEVSGNFHMLRNSFSVSNEKHKNCCIVRYQNTWTNLLSDGVCVIPSDYLDLYCAFSLIFYDDMEYRDRVKEMICAFESTEENVNMIASLLKTSANDQKEIKDEKIIEEHVRDLRWDDAKPYEPELFALASIFNVPVFVDTTGGGEHWSLYMPLVNNCNVLFDNPVMLKRNKDFKYKIVNCQGQCFCQQRKPNVKGKFWIVKDEFAVEVMKRIGLETCCPSPKRRGFHGHYKHIPDSKTNVTQPVDYLVPEPDVDAIQRGRLDIECRRIDQVGGGEGTLVQCLAKEIYGDETKTELITEHVNMDITDDNLLCYLQRVSDWTQLTVYLLSADDRDGYYSWQAINPTEHSDKRCRYYITILKHGRYFDRVIPKRGCNCQLASPLINLAQEPQNITSKLVIPKHERHLPMVTVVPSDPCEDKFEDEKRRLPIYSPLSEIRHISGRFDLMDRCIDASSDYTYSLYRCLSKEIFGTEKHFYSLVEYVVTEVRSNPEHYGRMFQKEGRSKIKDFFKFDSTIEKENADYYAERIEDGLNLEDLDLLAVSTFLQTPVFVLIIDDEGASRWTEYIPTRRIRRPVDLEQRKFQSKCHPNSYFVTLFRTSFGQYHRIVPMNADCNCLLEKPTELKVQIETLYVRQDNDAIQFTTRYREIESRLRAVEIALDKWNRSVITLEAFCEGVIVELEQVRHNVNIASIVGSSVGFIGASLALAGVIAAPFTFGTSLGLTIAGGVIGGAGGLTSVGSKFTEMALNKKPMDQLTRREMVLAERAVELRTCLSNLEESIEKCQDDIKPPSFDELHAIEAQALPGLLRMIKAFTILPVMVLRSANRVAVIFATILGPLSAVLDIGIGTFAVYNLVKGSKTSITENLRKVSVFLRSMRIQMQIWRYGTETSRDND
ncbi:hypothetical protein FSP39_020034 [Pinctada imbricata]|uniref:Apolipoprotein L3 n=1 Tax=Pinctada imbricata TaxID=66713 RepID=A0AA88Y1F2_PINIB|nr:hypothetical protein FSP39_020034 [Pinctada imbricata]